MLMDDEVLRKFREIFENIDAQLPVLAQSSTSGMTWGVGSIRTTQVTEEMVVMGCHLPVGTDIVLLTLD